MSIISQALKKAQREQRLQQTPPTPYGALTPRPSPARWRRLAALLAAGVGLVAVASAVVMYPGPSASPPAPVAMTVSAPPVASAAKTALPPVAPPLRPQVLERLPQPAAPPARSHVASPVGDPVGDNIARLTVPPVKPEPPAEPRPVAAEPSAPPAPIAASSPPLSPAEARRQAQPLLKSGIAAYNAGAFEAAETALQQAVALDPALKGAFNRLGNVYYQRDAFQQALAMYQKALALDPDYLEARNNLGNTYMRLGMSDRAIAELNKAILADGESGLSYYNLACAYARSGEPDKAIRYLQMAIAREPEARGWAKSDSDFTAVRPIPAFQNLLGTSS